MEIEPIDEKTVSMIARAIGPISSMVCNLGQVDVSRGCGILGPHEKCLWTEDGKRIRISMISGGGLIASCSKEPDPDAPPSA